VQGASHRDPKRDCTLRNTRSSGEQFHFREYTFVNTLRYRKKSRLELADGSLLLFILKSHNIVTKSQCIDTESFKSCKIACCCWSFNHFFNLLRSLFTSSKNLAAVWTGNLIRHLSACNNLFILSIYISLFLFYPSCQSLHCSAIFQRRYLQDCQTLITVPRPSWTLAVFKIEDSPGSTRKPSTTQSYSRKCWLIAWALLRTISPTPVSNSKHRVQFRDSTGIRILPRTRLRGASMPS